MKVSHTLPENASKIYQENPCGKKETPRPPCYNYLQIFA